MNNSKSVLNMFEDFQVSQSVYLTGGMSGRIDGSRTYQGVSFVDITWENGTETCDLPGSCYNDGGTDAEIGKTINMGR